MSCKQLASLIRSQGVRTQTYVAAVEREREVAARLRQAQSVAREIQWVSGRAAANTLDLLVAVTDIETRALRLVQLLAE